MAVNIGFSSAKYDTVITIAECNYKGKVRFGAIINKSKFISGNYYNIEIRK